MSVWLLAAGGTLLPAQDGKSPSWLSLGAEYRVRVESAFHAGLREESDDSYVLTRLRLNAEIRSLSWVRLFVQFQDARAFARDPGFSVPPWHDGMDLRQAYVQVGDADKSAFALRAGRQALRFGERRLMTDSTWRNVSRSYDAIRATWRRGDFRADVFAASVPEIRPGAWNNRRIDGNNIHGIYTTWSQPGRKTTLDVYAFWRLNPAALTERQTPAKSDTKTTGFRWAGGSAPGLECESEVAYQRGDRGPEPVRAWAGHWMVGRRFVNDWGAPFVYLEYDRASGDRNPGDGRHGAFDPLYGSTHERYGLVDLFSWRNIHHLRGSVEVQPARGWLVHLAHSRYWLASARDGLYGNSGSCYVRVPDGSAGRSVGQATGIHADWAVTSRMQLGAGYARLFPGSFLRRSTPGVSHNYMFLFVSGRI